MKIILNYTFFKVSAVDEEVTLDFFLKAGLPRKYLQLFEHEIADFDNLFGTFVEGLKSTELKIMVETKEKQYEVQILKNYIQKKIEIKVDGVVEAKSFIQWLNSLDESIGFTKDDLTNVVVKLDEYQTFEEIAKEIDNIHKLDIFEGGKENAALVEVENKIMELEKFVEDYKLNKEKVGSKKAEYEDLKNKLDKEDAVFSSLAEIIEKLEILKLRKAKIAEQYENLESIDIESVKQQKLKDLEKKFSEVNIQSRSGDKYQVMNEIREVVYQTFQGKGLLALVLIQFIISISLYFASFNTKILSFGIVGFSIQIILLIVLNFLDKPHLMVDFSYELQEDELGDEYTKQLAEGGMIVHKAMFDALSIEESKLKKIIASNVGEGVEYQEMLEEHKRELERLGQLDEELINMELASPEYYLHQRRELDKLKVEREDIKVSGSESTMNILKSPIVLANLRNTSEQLGEQVKNYVNKEYLENHKIYVYFS